MDSKTLGWVGWCLGGAVVLASCVAVTPDDGVAETSEGASSGEAEEEEGGSASMTSAGSMSASAGEAGEEEEGGEAGEEESASVEEGGGSVSVTAGEEEGTGGNEEGPNDTGSAEEEGGEETGPGIPFACDDLVCDAASEYCYEDIFDGPSEFSCSTFPARCADDPTCECLVPIVCPESLQACEIVDGAITIECVTG